MKKTAKILILFLFVLGSCDSPDKNEIQIPFSATVEIMDNPALLVNTPVHFKIKLTNVLHRNPLLGLSYTVADKASYIYLGDSPATPFSTDTVVMNDFVNNELDFFYVPQNGGRQTVIFRIHNDSDFSAVSEKEIEVKAGFDVNFIPPPKMTVNTPAESLTGYVVVTNSSDPDNYFNIVFRVLSGNENVPSISFGGISGNHTWGDTVRLLTGTGSKTLAYYYKQANEGRTGVEILVIDRYGYVVQRNYDFQHLPALELEIKGFGVKTYNRNVSPPAYYWTPDSYSYNLAYCTVSVKNKTTGEDYYPEYPLDVSFTLKYNVKVRYALTGVVTGSATKDILLHVNASECRQYFVIHNYQYTSTAYSISYFASPVLIESFNIVPTAQDEYRYVVKNTSTWLTGNEASATQEFDFYAPALTGQNSYSIPVTY